MRLSVQLYTVRDHLAKDLEGTLKSLKDAGLDYVELAGYYDRSAEDWKKLLDQLGLKVSGSHIGLDLFEKDLDKVIADNKTLENPYVIVPWLGEDQYAEGWDNVGARLETIGRKVKAAGLQLGYHNHAFEFPGGLDQLYANSTPENVVAQLDLAWVAIGGEKPAEYIARFGERAPLLHLKDYDPSKDPQWQVAGEGIMDWDVILAAAAKAGAKYGCIELDQSAIDPLEAVKKSIAFFHSKGIK